jgi:UDP-N-acetylmuramoylalanine--D-glutamate ligase
MDKKILIVGIGVTGFSLARYWSYKRQPFVMYDTRQNPPQLQEFQHSFPDIATYCEDYPASLLSQVSKIFTSPGVAQDCKLLQEARDLGITVENDLDCLAEEIQHTPLIAITGSNGKSTVTTWVGEIAKAAGLRVAVGGNLGTPVLDLWLEKPDYDLWVLELSSFQLANMQHLNIQIGTILNVSPDHLDMHGSMENYIAAKQCIYKFAKYGVFNREDTATIPQYPLGTQVSFGLSAGLSSNDWGITVHDGLSYLVKGEDIWLGASQLKLKGQHNWLNALATAALCDGIGISKSIIIQGLKDFSGLHHRTEWVAEIGQVTFINDSKGTNMGASIAAIEGIGATISGKIILIAGGLSKGADLSPMRTCLNQYVKHVVLIGQDAELLERYWQGAVPLSHESSLIEAVNLAYRLAEPGDLVLLSPACASFDMFNGYEHRGQQFVKIVKEMHPC